MATPSGSSSGSNVLQTGTDTTRKSSVPFFEDVNPEIDGRTAFQRRLPHAGGDSMLTLINTPQEVIDREIANNMKGGERPPRLRQNAQDGCFEILQRANPKGVVQRCEMCSDKATLCCNQCGVTYYCGWDHRLMDNFHHNWCAKLKILRWPDPYCMNGDHRRRLKAQKLLVMEKLLLDLVQQGFVNIYEGNFERAIGNLLQCLKYIEPVYGVDYKYLHLIIVFTAICEAQLGNGNIKMAEKALNNAFTLLGTAEDRADGTKLNYAKAQVNKAQGLLRMEAKNYQDAVFYFAECVYFISEVTSPKDVRACVGYFNLARCFLAIPKRKVEGVAMLSFCIGLWFTFLRQILITLTTQGNTAKPYMHRSDVDHAMSPYLKMEAIKQLAEVWDYLNEKNHPGVFGQVLACQGMLMFIEGKWSQVKTYARRAMAFQEVCLDPEVSVICRLLEKHAGRRESRM